MDKVRVRFAPSPTGELHIGGVRTALFNWLFARNMGGKFILRIDDTDKQRSADEFMESILSSFQWLGLDWDEGPITGGDFGPYRQSERLSLYQGEARKLLEQDKAYPCFCSVEELEMDREKCRRLGQPPRYSGRCRSLSPSEVEEKKAAGQEFVIRAITPYAGETVVDDLIRGKVTFENKGFDDPIIIKSDGLPTYNFASVVDDYEMRITHVIRAEEHLSNTPRQQLIAWQLGYAIPQYAHVSMILAPDHSKLSKRHGATSVQEYRSMGILPEALLNYLALLGWSPGEDREIMNLDVMVSLFSLKRVSKNPAIYDLPKLTWLNGHYLRTGELNRIAEMAIPFLQKKGIIGSYITAAEKERITKIVQLVRVKVKTLAEIADASQYLFSDEFDYDAKGVAKHFKKEGSGFMLKRIEELLETIDPFTPEEIERRFALLSDELQISLSKINPATRLAISGRLAGPELFPLLSLMGKEKAVERLKRVQELFIEENN